TRDCPTPGVGWRGLASAHPRRAGLEDLPAWCAPLKRAPADATLATAPIPPGALPECRHGRQASRAPRQGRHTAGSVVGPRLPELPQIAIAWRGRRRRQRAAAPLAPIRRLFGGAVQRRRARSPTDGTEDDRAGLVPQRSTISGRAGQ